MNPSMIRRRDIIKVHASTDVAAAMLIVCVYQRRCYCAADANSGGDAVGL